MTINGRFAYIDWDKLDQIAFAWAHQYFDEGNFEVFFCRDESSAYIEAPCAGPENRWKTLFDEFDPEGNYEVEHEIHDVVLLRAMGDTLAQECGFKPVAMFATEFGIFFFDAPLPNCEFVSEDENCYYKS